MAGSSVLWVFRLCAAQPILDDIREKCQQTPTLSFKERQNIPHTSTMERNAVQFLHCTGSALIVHEADEPVGKSLACVRVSHNSNLVDLSILTKYSFQIGFGAEFGKISEEERAVWRK